MQVNFSNILNEDGKHKIQDWDIEDIFKRYFANIADVLRIFENDLLLLPTSDVPDQIDKSVKKFQALQSIRNLVCWC